MDRPEHEQDLEPEYEAMVPLDRFYVPVAAGARGSASAFTAAEGGVQ